ncbi:Amino acid transporter transmembrane [Trichophyton interdigitale]|uniref:Amino acid transporter transmembrane n=1 Tax=Trichophyton interdigitale TaxID=101480 RepID=A0A9P4YIR2_9EURO|nr:Amino acid transporter transmembrane [Trichophyton interdigitale]KAF3897844.1 Amino acid transporter transmembrane [Trichophyton interdigitale]KAG8210158.1 Amino acid transporter transmembrane [Trichophyton interdigitale]
MDDDGGAVGGRSRRRQWPGKKDGGVVGQAGWTSSVVNLVNTIVGAGALAMPHAISRMGMFLGVTVVLWAGLTSAFGLYLQTRCARYLERGTSSFFALSQITYPNAAVIFDAAIAIKCFGVGVSYLIIIGDLMPGVIEGFVGGTSGVDFLYDRHFWVTAFMLIVIPLSFLRRLDSLKYTSIVALTSIGYLVILVVAHFIKGDTMADRGPIHFIEWQGLISALSVFPVIVFAYTCHQNMFSILNEIANDSHYRTTSVIVTSIGSAAATYVLVGVTGYLSFGDTIGGNIVGMYAPSLTSTIARAAIVILVIFSYPLQIHPCRASLDAVLKWRPNSNKSPANTHSQNRNPLLPRTSPPSDGMSDMRFAIITTVIIVLSYIVAMTVSSLEAVLAYVGATGSTSISFILPGLFYYKISSPESAAHQRLMKEDDELDAEEHSNEVDPSADASQGLLGQSYARFMSRSTGQWRRGLLRKLSLGLVVYGVVVMVVCLVTNTFFLASDIKG